MIAEIVERTKLDQRVLVTTLTKRMAEELTEYLINYDIRATFIHSDVASLDRVKIINDLRAGLYDVLVGVNLLREGLDIPEVSLVAILDADKEGFLRSHRSLTQTAGRAARNVNGKVIMYADTITESMQKTIDETNYRREKQLKYNELHHIIPHQIERPIKDTLPTKGNKVSINSKEQLYPIIENTLDIAADPIVDKMSRQQLKKSIEDTTLMMKQAAKELNFIQAAAYRDEIIKLQEKLKQKE